MNAVERGRIAISPAGETTERRNALARLASLVFALPCVGAPRSALAAGEIEQPRVGDAAHFMRRAMQMKQLASDTGDQAYGAIVVRDGRIIGQAPSRVVVNTDPTAHGEMEALRDAGRRLGTHDLRGCELYTSARPCRMCETAAYWAGIAQVWYGDQIADAGPPRYSSC